MSRMVIGLKDDPLWHIIPNQSWRDAFFYGKGPARMPCGATGPYRGRLDFEKMARFMGPGERFCIDCLQMEATGEWPPDPEWSFASLGP